MNLHTQYCQLSHSGQITHPERFAEQNPDGYRETPQAPGASSDPAQRKGTRFQPPCRDDARANAKAVEGMRKVLWSPSSDWTASKGGTAEWRNFVANEGQLR